MPAPYNLTNVAEIYFPPSLQLYESTKFTAASCTGAGVAGATRRKGDVDADAGEEEGAAGAGVGVAARPSGEGGTRMRRKRTLRRPGASAPAPTHAGRRSGARRAAAPRLRNLRRWRRARRRPSRSL